MAQKKTQKERDLKEQDLKEWPPRTKLETNLNSLKMTKVTFPKFSDKYQENSMPLLAFLILYIDGILQLGGIIKLPNSNNISIEIYRGQYFFQKLVPLPLVPPGQRWYLSWAYI